MECFPGFKNICIEFIFEKMPYSKKLTSGFARWREFGREILFLNNPIVKNVKLGLRGILIAYYCFCQIGVQLWSLELACTYEIIFSEKLVSKLLELTLLPFCLLKHLAFIHSPLLLIFYCYHLIVGTSSVPWESQIYKVNDELGNFKKFSPHLWVCWVHWLYYLLRDAPLYKRGEKFSHLQFAFPSLGATNQLPNKDIETY